MIDYLVKYSIQEGEINSMLPRVESDLQERDIYKLHVKLLERPQKTKT